MYIRELKIQHLKRLREFSLTFPGPVAGKRGKEHMPWTVLIGENGTCKTAILQAIAMAAAGGRQVNNLADKVVGHLVDRRSDLGLSIEAIFRFPRETGGKQEYLPSSTREFDWLREAGMDAGALQLCSTLRLESRQDTIFGLSWYCLPEARPSKRGMFHAETQMDKEDDVLDQARSQSLSYWFVAAYGISRILPDPAFRPAGLSPIDRLKPLFDPSVQLTSTSFANYFADDPKRTQRFAVLLQSVLLPKGGRPLLPELTGLTLSGRGGVKKAGDLLDRHRFKQRFGGEDLGIPAVALAHGYQSTIAWIADLIGHILLDAEDAIRPAEMTGLVLVDEIDLYIHPALQVSLIRNLKQTFPRIQFVVTTHSPLVLAAMRTDEDELVRLVVDSDTGDVVRRDMREGQAHEPDARTMTTAGIYETWFGLPDVFGGPEGGMLAEYQSIASNPYRSEAADKRMQALDRELREVGVDPVYRPVARAPRAARAK